MEPTKQNLPDPNILDEMIGEAEIQRQKTEEKEASNSTRVLFITGCITSVVLFIVLIEASSYYHVAAPVELWVIFGIVVRSLLSDTSKQNDDGTPSAIPFDKFIAYILAIGILVFAYPLTKNKATPEYLAAQAICQSGQKSELYLAFHGGAKAVKAQTDLFNSCMNTIGPNRSPYSPGTNF